MQKMYKPSRIVLVFLVTAAMLAVFLVNLYVIQIYEARAFDPNIDTPRTTTRTVNLPAARGNIYDRNGILLASGRPTFNVMLDMRQMRARGQDAMNRNILDLIFAAVDQGYTHIDTFPVGRFAPFSFDENMTNEQRRRLDAFFAEHEIDPEISASDLMTWMRNHYRIDYTIGILDARLIVGVRYELDLRHIVNINPYIFISDVSTDFITLLAERDYFGVFEESSFIREYHTAYASHLIGYIRRMSPQQFEVLREYGYPIDALVGQIGAEYAFERDLRGFDGRKRVSTTSDGTIVNVVHVAEPEPGNHVYLTIDIDLQAAVEQALRTQIHLINSGREAEARLSGDDINLDEILIPGGAVVVQDVRTGEILAAASYPTFDLRTLNQDFAMLNLDPRGPMLNRATHGRFAPGSTFKMLTGFAGLRYEVIGNMHYTITCVGIYRRLADLGFTPRCWIYPIAGVGHGPLDFMRAMEASCNYYFIWIADRLPALTGHAYMQGDLLARVSREFGLGVPTGIELPENTGTLATQEWLTEASARGVPVAPIWSTGLTIQTGFGQGYNRFTPLQLANYTSTIANGGTLHELSILSRVMSHDFSETIDAFEPTVRSRIEETEYIEILRESMLAASRGPQGTARSVFGNYPILVGSKTGTSQGDGRDINYGIFVAYAPHNNPEIAVSIAVEKGGSGSAVMDISRMIFDHYFSTESAITVVPYGRLIP